jgi:hypothetical protein
VSSFCSSVVASEGVVYAMESGPDGGGGIAVRVGGKGDVSGTHVVWSGNQSNRIGAPIVHNGKLYSCSNVSFIGTGDVNEVIAAGKEAAVELRKVPAEKFAQCLELFAQKIAAHADVLVDIAHRESALPKEPRLSNGELSRTSDQLRKAAGLKLSAAADKAGKPIYLEMSGVNPVFALPGAIEERSDEIATELFGSCALGAGQFCTNPGLIIVQKGNLTGCSYSRTQGNDDDDNGILEPELRTKVGRLLNDTVSTSVAVVSSMNHGGPYPATVHPGFAAVRLPASMFRFAALYCYDNIWPERLPIELQNKNPTRSMWRMIDGEWAQKDI